MDIFNWTVAGFFATTIGLIVALVLGYASWKASASISENLAGVSERLEHLENRDEEILLIVQDLKKTTKNLMKSTDDLQKTTKNLLKITETARLLDHLDDEAWPSYLEQIQAEALNSDYLVPIAGELRPADPLGRKLLQDSDLIKKIDNVCKAELPCPENVVIRQLGVNYLFDKATEKDVTLDTMIAVVHSYLQETSKRKKDN